MEKRKNSKGKAGADVLQPDIISANEYTGCVQGFAVTNEDIRRYKEMYGVGADSENKS